jgi:hypothetical protein
MKFMTHECIFPVAAAAASCSLSPAPSSFFLPPRRCATKDRLRMRRSAMRLRRRASFDDTIRWRRRRSEDEETKQGVNVVEEREREREREKFY